VCAERPTELGELFTSRKKQILVEFVVVTNGKDRLVQQTQQTNVLLCQVTKLCFARHFCILSKLTRKRKITGKSGYYVFNLKLFTEAHCNTLGDCNRMKQREKQWENEAQRKKGCQQYFL
jgi:hypothetical protein